MELRDKIDETIEITDKETTAARHKSKEWFDKNALVRKLKVGQLVLLYLPTENKPLATKLHGPYEIIEKQGSVNYIRATPDKRKKTLLCHINLLRAYIKRENRFDTIILLEI